MGKIIGYCRALINSILVVTLSVMVLVVSAQVIWRYLFNSPLDWTEEIARICLIITTFLGSALAIQKNMHFRIDVLIRMLPAPMYRVAEALICLIAAGYMGIVVYGSIYMMQNINMGIISALGIPAKTIYLVFPLGGFMMIVNLLDNAWKTIRCERGIEQ